MSENKKENKSDAIERLKWETAMDLGLLPKVLEKGWEYLTAEETGRLGGIVARKLKKTKSNK
ncbi:small, acid-soluble spore protein, alpha/beta type [Natranaerofaba carboxydovora]|uniref:small, acid-soluble spore protein, alpha/beta type n=1 Tax=Natranaerofaba carboxydovora TaxID=2742683 RepID=UPI001F130365|nr:small, acid-soluble spore protein, alpha/beta type [Natranaerofaba carboxydovora]UMZ73190.1 hypothetical protein ACONDI_00743 [Natranaerofaba carboxydovora]